MLIYSLLFYVFSFLAIVASLMVVSAKSPVHSVLWLIFVFFNVAGIFILIGAEFLAMILIIVYVGAVAVLFLFVVMMLNVSIDKIKQNSSGYILPFLFISLILLVDLYLAFKSSTSSVSIIVESAYPIPDVRYVTNTHALADILYKDFFYPFQISGIILLVAMISSIVLTLRSRKTSKKQNISRQVLRNRYETVELINVKSRKGLDG